MRTENTPSDEALTARIQELVRTVDLHSIGVNAFTRRLSREFGGADLNGRSSIIRQVLEKEVQKMGDSFDEDESRGDQKQLDEPAKEEDEEKVLAKKRPRYRRKRRPDWKPSTGLFAKKKISDQLANLVGSDEPMSHLDAAKWVWDYVKEHGLHDTQHGSEVRLDGALREVFGVDTFNYFTMRMYIGEHIEPFKPVDPEKLNQILDTSSDKERPKKRRKKTNPQSKKISDKLAHFIGRGDWMSRDEISEWLLQYIKEHDLQNPQDRREVRLDDAMREVFEVDTFTLLSMQRYISAHIDPFTPVDSSKHGRTRRKRARTKDGEETVDEETTADETR